MHSIGDAVITTDGMGNIVNVNPISESLTGWKASETKNKPLSILLLILLRIKLFFNNLKIIGVDYAQEYEISKPTPLVFEQFKD